MRRTLTNTDCDHRSRRRGSTLWRLRTLAVGAGVIGALFVGGGVFAAWTPTSSMSTGSLSAANLGVTTTDQNGTTFTAGVSNLLPGDYLNRYVDLTNTGSVAQTFSGTMTGGGTLGGALTGQVDICSAAWSSNGSCSGTTTSIQAAAVTGSAVSFSFPSLASNGVLHTRFQFKLLPNASQSTYQGTSTAEVVSLVGNTTVAGGQDRSAG